MPTEPVEKNESLVRAVWATAHTYNGIVDDALKPQWHHITRTLHNLQVSLGSLGHTVEQVASKLRGMETGDILVFLNKNQDIGIFFTKRDHSTVYESFRHPALDGSYLEWAIEITDQVFHNQWFQAELANFLRKEDGFSGLLTGILRGVGQATEVQGHTIKHFYSHFRLQYSHRCFIWLLIKIAITMSLGSNDPSHICYKVFLLRFMCNLAMDAIDANLSSHLLHAVSCKIIRRLGKLGPLAPNWLQRMAVETNHFLRETLEARWKVTHVTRPPPPPWEPWRLDLDEDTQRSLRRSKDYIRMCLRNDQQRSSVSPFHPKHLRRGGLYDFLSSDGAFFEEAYRTDPYIALYDVECAVEQGIDDWVACVSDVDEACVQVGVLMDKYLSSAVAKYKGNPEHMSTMLLTGIELWIAIDKLVGQAPTLVDHAPGTRRQLPHIPLICKTTSLQRLSRAYQHLSARYPHFLLGRPMLSREPTQNILPVPHVDSVDDGAISKYGRTKHPLKIAAVFELRCRASLRISCIGILRLLSLFPSHRSRQVAPAVELLLEASLVEEWTSVKNQVYLIYFCRENVLSKSGFTQPLQLHDYFSYRHPTSHRLDQYTNTASHTSNDVLAAQSECPDDLSLHEFIAFGHLRNAGSLQWANILRELRSRTLNLRRHDVYCLLASAASQVGIFDPNTTDFEWHQELQEPLFCRSLLDEVQSILADVALHSQDGVMMSTITLLLTRLLASSPCEDISEGAIRLVRLVRRKVLSWVEELSYDLTNEPMNIERKDLLRDMAATCRSTFDVGRNDIRSTEDVTALLFCAILIHANLPHNLHSISDYSRLLLERDRRLSLTLGSALRDAIEADASNRGVDLAVCGVWPGYRPGPRAWRALSQPNSNWFTCETAATRSTRSQTMHLNLLDGTLLVDGKPIDGLPDEMRRKPTYRQIFGDQRFLVVPSILPGMDFSSLAMVCEHRVHFALREGNLVIRAQQKNADDIFEVIPRCKLEEDLPARLVSGCVHWLNRRTSIIEIRPRNKCWDESPENWKIDCRPGRYRVYKGCEWLVDIRSPTYDMISSRLKYLDGSRNLIVSTFPADVQSTSARRLSVVLPHYGLSFFMNEEGDLESQDFKNMVYDEDQCIGTLFGLENRLVLRPKIERDHMHRRVIIPDGRICRQQYQHSHITIETPAIRLTPDTTVVPRVPYHSYRVDTDLGSLVGDGSWWSRQYLAHLHAHTSTDWMPDPLTGKTGIYEALCLSQSAGSRSIMELDTCQRELTHINYGTYPQLQFAMEETWYRIERNRFLCGSESGCPSRPRLDLIGALRTAYLFPFEVIGPVPKPFNLVPCKPSEPEELAHTISLAVYHWFIKAWNRTELRDDNTQPAGAPLNANLNYISPLIAEAETHFEGPGSAKRKLLSPPPSIAEVEAVLREATEAHRRFRLLFLLPTIPYSAENAQPAFLSILVALSKRFPLENPPRYDECSPLDGWHPSRRALLDCCAKFPMSHMNVRFMADLLYCAWPFKSLPVINLGIDSHNTKKLNDELTPLVSRCYSNLELKKDLTCRLTKLSAAPNLAQSPRQRSDLLCEGNFRRVTLYQLLRDRSPPEIPTPRKLEPLSPISNKSLSDSKEANTGALAQLFCSLHMNENEFQRQYITRLHVSSQCVFGAPRLSGRTHGRPSIEELRKYFVQCKEVYTTALAMLREKLRPLGGLTPETLFRYLASISSFKLSDPWKKCLVSLALLLLQLQRSRRLLQLALNRQEEELSKELENEGCDGWKANDYPDWLLVQAQGNFLIRGIQADIAINMISQPSGQNATTQVNMGEGKSSVILPISAATLADGNQLARIIVPKPLIVQTFRLLVDRLGGLVNRPIYHIPFFRSGGYSERQVQLLHQVLYECMHEHGILVVQPDHVLSLKLSSVEHQLTRCLYSNGRDSYHSSACMLLELQKLIHSRARDILDESDDILHPRLQLTYTFGQQPHVEGSPDRWIIIQQVFKIVRKYSLSLSRDLPDAIEYELNAPGSFPRIRILRSSDARERLTELIAYDVMNGGLANFSIRDVDPNRPLGAAIRRFICSRNVSQQDASLAEEYCLRTGLWPSLLLLRGLLACDVLLFALAERRWRVDYGLAPERTTLAVPYRAKDVPAARAEFGHPDVTILLTCLSYYYGGLTEEQLRASFEILQELPHPSAEYATWLHDYGPTSVPEPILDLGNINIKSSEQWNKHIFPLFARNQGAVDLYLSNVVFPKEAKEFPFKLAASSWDIAEIRERPITGFSGTNDGQYLLPTTITQRDLGHQLGSNARVLSHLLQPENNSYMSISHPSGERRTTHELLRILVEQQPKIQVLLDVGAQILDLSNYELAKAWLELTSDSDGAIYFSETDELMVLTKNSHCRPLMSSPLALRLDRCVIYLDDSHTRGTDLKLPRGSRAAVTLGPKVTKDRLVQGCMRMRKLGHGHSVMFLAPLEVDRSIRVVAGKENLSVPITTTDILHWAIRETWTEIQRWAPYWAQRGINYHSRCDAWSRFCKNDLAPEQIPGKWPGPEPKREESLGPWLQADLKSLVDLYAPFQRSSVISRSSVLNDYPEIQERCRGLGVLKLPEAHMEEEQEREVNRELEREREVQKRPSKAVPAEHSLHPDVVAFVRDGVIPANLSRSTFLPVLTALEGTSAADKNTHVWSPFVLATSDFCRIVDPESCQGNTDPYLRPVQWVLSGKWHHDRILVLLSPFEADRLMPNIRASKYVHLHVYTPRTSERMRPADDLTCYSIPPVPNDWTAPRALTEQVNLFAGQLYLRDYESYLQLRGFLARRSHDPPENANTAVLHNLNTSGLLQNAPASTDSSLPFVMTLLAIRRRGLSFADTHMGRILRGEQLTKKDFQNIPWAKSGASLVARDAQITASAPTEEVVTAPLLPQSSDQGWMERPRKRLRTSRQ